MQTLPCLRLKKGKEKPILQHHHWIYSGAIQELPQGKMATVQSSKGEHLGLALLNPGHSITAHMIAFGSETIEEAIEKRIQSAIEMRSRLFDPTRTNAIRLINAEGDGIPGLIVDAYKDVLVLQISHPALESFKDHITQILKGTSPRSIYEKSTSFLRKKGGMEEARALLFGEDVPEVEILENGLTFTVNVQTGQKTGLFLDQREMRQLVREFAKGKRILNGFAYTGGFTIAALSGGAAHVDHVEISSRCKESLAKNIALNHLPEKAIFIEQDFFDFLKTTDWNYDLVILDPPAFVKKREDIAKGFRAYKELNKEVLRNMKKGSLLLTCSCSYHVEETLFQNILFRASLEANRRTQILSRHRQALDHPISVFHPESAYLKSLFLYVS